MIVAGVGGYYLIVVVVAWVAMEVLHRWLWASRWETRGITTPRWNWYVRGVATVGFPAVLYANSELLPPPTVATVLFFAVVGWVGAVSAGTDIAVTKIPKEPSWTVFAVGVASLAVNVARGTDMVAVWVFLASLAVTGTVLLFVAAVTKGSLGSGDVRLMVALTPLSAYAGFAVILLTVGVGCVLQLVAWKTVYRHKGKTRPFGPSLLLALPAVVYIAGISPLVEWSVLVAN